MTREILKLQEEVKEIAKRSLKDYYYYRECINKEDYKYIMRKTVNKVSKKNYSLSTYS